MIEEVIIKWEPGALEKLTKTTPDKIMYQIARTTLDLVMPTIPERTGKMKKTEQPRS